MNKPTAKNVTDEVLLLKQEITDLEEKLETYRTQLGENCRMSENYSNFIANFNHELLTPLNSILGLLDLSLEIPMSSKLKVYLTQAKSAGHQLKKIAKNAQLLTQLDKLHFKPELAAFDMHETLEHLASKFRTQLNKKSLDFEIVISPQLPCLLMGAVEYLEQILAYLLENAIKFTPKGKVSLLVKLIPSESTGVFVQFSIVDTGIGIKKNDLDKIFEPFYQGDSSSTRLYSGVGLGLSLCKRIVTPLNGNIVVESEPGKGSTFSFKLYFELQEAIAQKKYQLPSHIYPCRVMVVDLSSQPIQKSLRPLLKDFGLDTDYIKTFPQLSNFLDNYKSSKKSFEMLIVHLETVEKKYIHLLSSLESLSKMVKTIVITPMGNTYYLAIYKHWYVDRFIEKPLTMPMFYKVIYNLCSSVKTQQKKPELNQSIPPNTSLSLLFKDRGLQQHLVKLATVLDYGDQSAAEKLVLELKMLCYDRELDILLEKINDFDFDQALSSLQKIIQKLDIK